ncbi:hypothetical protein VTH82DRAFT_6756 [Thermothelomyces myriococcoides]
MLPIGLRFESPQIALQLPTSRPEEGLCRMFALQGSLRPRAPRLFKMRRSRLAVPLVSTDLNTPKPVWSEPYQDPGVPDLGAFVDLGWVPDNTSGGWQDLFAIPDQGMASVDGSSSGTSLSNSSMAVSKPLSPERDPFLELSAYLSLRWTTAEQGFQLIDRELKSYVDGLPRGLRRMPFVHRRDWEESRRPLVLVEAMAVAQLYSMRTPQCEPLLLQSIDERLIAIRKNLPTHTRADDIATAQAVLLYAIMRIYRSGSMAMERVHRISLELMHHVVHKSLRCLQPFTNVTPNDWEEWIMDESLRRCFFTLHALDYVVTARQCEPTALCGIFPDAPLPCPTHVWDAPTAEEWAARYRAWEESNRRLATTTTTTTTTSGGDGGSGGGGHLRARDMHCWLGGKESGRERQLLAWFHQVEESWSGVVFECARAQARARGVESLISEGRE